MQSKLTPAELRRIARNPEVQLAKFARLFVTGDHSESDLAGKAWALLEVMASASEEQRNAMNATLTVTAGGTMDELYQQALKEKIFNIDFVYVMRDAMQETDSAIAGVVRKIMEGVGDEVS